MSQGATSQRLRPFKPTLFGRYTLLMPISTGGMGEVFLARLEGAHGFDKLCVIKKILPHLAEDTDFVERFVNEARILVKLSHGNIAQVLDMGVHEGAPYIALEFVDGKDLRRVLARMRDRNLPLPLSFVLYTMIRVLDALAYAHRKRDDDDQHELNLVHRDVSPQNVLISYEGEVKVIDFGLAKSTLSNAKTNPSIVLGKFLYMSPEQARHQKVDRRSDLYAVGLCLYELIAGKNPYDEVPPGELMAKVANPQIKALSDEEPMCPPTLSEAVMKALSPEPSLRFQTAEEFRATLQGVLTDLDPATGPETASRFMREAFSAEFATERRMLSAMKDRAKTAVEGEPSSAGPAPESAGATESEESTGGFDDTDPSVRRAVTRDAMRATTELEIEAQRETVPLGASVVRMTPSRGVGASGSQPQTPTAPAMAIAEPLSFAPTPKLSFEPTKKLKQHDERDDGETSPSIPVVSEPMNIGPTPEVGNGPSIVIDGLPEDDSLSTTEPARPIVTSKSLRAVARDKSASKAKPSAPRAPKKKAPRATPPAKADRAPPDVGLPPKPRPPSVAAAPVKPKAGSVVVWVVVPLLAVAAVGSYIAWDMYTDRLRESQADQESVRADPPKKRELRVHEDVPPTVVTEPKPDPKIEVLKPDPEPVVVKAEVIAEEKKAAPVIAVPKTTVVAVVPAASPGDRALKLLKADFDKLQDEVVQKRFQLKVTSLGDRVATQGADPAFVKSVEDLHAQIRAELEKQ